MKGDARDKFEFEEDADAVERGTQEVDYYANFSVRQSRNLDEELNESSEDSDLGGDDDVYDVFDAEKKPKV